MRGIAKAAVLVIGAVALTACGAGKPASTPGNEGRGSTVTTHAPPGGFEAFTLAPGQLAEAMRDEGLSAYQKAFVEDGLLTFSEYEAAAFATVDCLEDAGLSVFHVPGELEHDRAQATPGPGLSARGRYRFDVGAAPSQRADLLEASARCRAEYFDLLDLLWTEHTAPSERDLQLGRAMIASCLHEKGIAVPNNPSQQELFDHAWPPDGDGRGKGQPVPDYWDCATRTADQLGLSGFIG